MIKRKKKKSKIERRIRKRILELEAIKESYGGEDDKDARDCISGVIAEIYSILGEEEPKPKSNRAYEKEIRELEKKNQKLQISINILKGEA